MNKEYVKKGITAGFIVYIAFIALLLLFNALSYDGKCGLFMSSSCSFGEHFFDGLIMAIAISIVSLPILLLVGGISGYIVAKLNKQFNWVYLPLLLILVAYGIIIFFDPFEMF